VVGIVVERFGATRRVNVLHAVHNAAVLKIPDTFLIVDLLDTEEIAQGEPASGLRVSHTVHTCGCD